MQIRPLLLAVAVVSSALAVPTVLAQCSGGSCPAPTGFGRGYSFSAQALPVGVQMRLAPMARQFMVQSDQILQQLGTPVIDSPRVYEIKDAAGASWQHRDETYLKAWVAGRDAGISTIRKAPGQCSCLDCKCGAKAAARPVVSTPEVPAERVPTAKIDDAPEPDIKPLVPKFPPKPTVRSYRHAG